MSRFGVVILYRKGWSVLSGFRWSVHPVFPIESHQRLVNLVAERIRMVNSVPRFNQFIDLAATYNQDYIFEMKSTTADVRSQVRKGITQLYEYRYLQNKPDARLVLVVENPLSEDVSWMIDYIEKDREINLVWDGNNNLYGTEQTRSHLGFLGLLP